MECQVNNTSSPVELSKLEERLHNLRDRIQKPQDGDESVSSTGQEYYKVEKFTSATVLKREEDSDEHEEEREKETELVSKIDDKQLSVLQQVFGACSITGGQDKQLGSVHISQSQGVHVGNVCYVVGDVHVKQEVKVVQQQALTQQVFLSPDRGGEQVVHSSGQLRILKRVEWLAQPPMEPPLPLDLPVPLVVISHTATEMGFSVAQNTFLVRSCQTYHIESRNWDDIAYNFLIGMDGNVYEGRGWKSVGAHAYGFNKKSIGISFIGCFMRCLPTDVAMTACKKLIALGVELGHIKEDYKLCGHCQLSAVESPGKAFYDVMVEWPHWAPQP